MGRAIRTNIVVACCVLGAAAATSLVLSRFYTLGIGSSLVFAVMAALVLASWIKPIVVYQGSSSLADHLDEGFCVLFLLVLPPPGILAAFLLSTAISQAVHRRSLMKSAFNVGQIVLATCAAVALDRALGPPTAHLTSRMLGAALIGGVAYALVNRFAIATVLAATGTARFASSFTAGLETRLLLVGASVLLGVLGGLAISVYTLSVLLVAPAFWTFRMLISGHFRSRYDRTRLTGLFDATLEVNRHMSKDEVTDALSGATSQLLRSPEVSIAHGQPPTDLMAAPMTVRGENEWLVVSGRLRSEPFDSADRALLEALAAVGSGALENASLYAERIEQEQRLVAITSSLAEGVCAIDALGRITFLNPAAQALLGWEGFDPSTGSDEEVLAELGFLIEPALRSLRAKSTVSSERSTFLRRDGTSFPVEFTCSPIRPVDEEGTSEVAGAVIAFRDISERVAFEEQLAFHAFHDALTGLPNRRVFVDRLQHALERSARTGATHAVLFADLDRFKVANDSLGHQAGDHLLVEIANRFRSIARDGDTLARFGGDEFTLLLEDVESPEAAEEVASRMLAVAREPFIIDGRTVLSTSSIGIAPANAGSSPDDVLHDADVAMYYAKNHGGDAFSTFDARAMGARSAELVDLEVQLREAIERREFVVYYQPLFSTGSREVVGAEALIRWNHPTRGLLGPAHFVGFAEETGLILPLGRFVLEQSAQQSLTWWRMQGSKFSISVNLSARQFQAPTLVNEVRDVLARSALQPSHLCFEITESLAMQDVDRTIATLSELKSLGVRLAIDDFGTGHSSLSYLKRFPVDVVKLDRSFVQDLDKSMVDAAIVAAVLDLARTIGITAVAEGVETEDQFRRLSEMGCPIIQGFLLGRPMPAEDLTALISSGLMDLEGPYTAAAS